jgi:hypothetical protein
MGQVATRYVRPVYRTLALRAPGRKAVPREESGRMIPRGQDQIPEFIPAEPWEAIRRWAERTPLSTSVPLKCRAKSSVAPILPLQI